MSAIESEIVSVTSDGARMKNDGAIEIVIAIDDATKIDECCCFLEGIGFEICCAIFSTSFDTSRRSLSLIHVDCCCFDCCHCG